MQDLHGSFRIATPAQRPSARNNYHSSDPCRESILKPVIVAHGAADRRPDRDRDRGRPALAKPDPRLFTVPTRFAVHDGELFHTGGHISLSLTPSFHRPAWPVVQRKRKGSEKFKPKVRRLR